MSKEQLQVTDEGLLNMVIKLSPVIRVHRKCGRTRNAGTLSPKYAVVCLNETGPQAAMSFPGQQLVKPTAPEAERAKKEIDYGRRGAGYVFGAFQPASGGPYSPL